MSLIRDAFLAVRQEFSPDRIVADPELNEQFVQQCHPFGLQLVPKSCVIRQRSPRTRGLARINSAFNTVMFL